MPEQPTRDKRRKGRPGRPRLLSLDEIAKRMERTLGSSTADETEIAWLEVRRSQARKRGPNFDFASAPERTVLVRVIDRGRVGSHRTGTADPGELEVAVRLAVTQSRAREPVKGLPHLPTEDEELIVPGQPHDGQISQLDEERARGLLDRLPRGRELATIRWSEGRVAVFNSRGVRRRAEVTAADLEVRCGRRPGAGRAADAARSLSELSPEHLLERARLRHAAGDLGELGDDSPPMLLSPESTAGLFETLNRAAFSADAYYDGKSLLRRHLGDQVFDRSLTLRDDGTDPAGLPFPFDLEGTAKRPIDLVTKGTLKTPALDQRQAAQLGLPPTAHAISGNDARAMNLFVEPGALSNDEMLAAAEGGLWIGWLERLECFDRARLQIRAHARGVRRVRGGKLAEALPDLVWEDSLLRMLSNVLAIGNSTTRRLSEDGFLGGISTPALALPSAGELKPG